MMKTCKAEGCTQPLRFQNGKHEYCVMHLARLKRNGHLGLKTGEHGLEKMPHSLVDNLIRENCHLKDSELAELLAGYGFDDITRCNVKYRRRKLGIKKYSGKGANAFAKKIAVEAYGEKCELCDFYVVTDVHHIVGRKGKEKKNNELSNLTVLCPNCHAMVSRKILPLNHRDEIPKLRETVKEITSRNSVCT